MFAGIKLVSKVMTSQPVEQTIEIYILSNISKGKGNQTIKFGQLIEYSMTDIMEL